MTPASALTMTLRTLGDLAELRGASREASDLRRAAAAIDALPMASAARLEERARRDQPGNEPGVTPALHRQVRELSIGGHDAAVTAARGRLPVLLRRLLDLGSITTAEAVLLVRQFGVLTLPDLHAALDEGRVKQTAGEALDTRLRQGASAVESEVRPLTLGRAHNLLDPLLSEMAACHPSLDAVVPAGDVRRFEALPSSLIVVGRASDPPAAVDALCGMRGLHSVLHRSGRRAIVMVEQVEIDIRIAAPDEYGTVLFNATGSRAHLDAIRQRRGRPRLAPREADVYAQAGLALIEPELRQGAGEVEAAADGRLPVLVSREHIRGDLHMHSTYSDGRDTIATMVAACCALGYDYIAITDHSESAAAGRTVSVDQLARQRDEIALAREQYPRIAILHGIECDILPDGRLDFADEVLEGLDIVLASLHDDARHDGKTLTRRCIQAIRHPLVSIITHPTNRLVGRRSGYPLDFDAVYAAAAETGTALEIDGAPSHLDLDGEHARAAVAAGATVAIDSDCHRADALDRQMRLGIGMARRGWVEPGHVLNARPLDEVLAFIAAKRGPR